MLIGPTQRWAYEHALISADMTLSEVDAEMSACS